MPTLLYILIFTFGLCIGSFLNVVILRVPAGESIVTGPSHCPRCGRKLKWYELFPLFSFLALRGRCSGCGERISPQYPIVEAANGLLWLFLFWQLGIGGYALLVSLLASVLLALSVIDARTGEIPLGLNAAVLVLAVLATVLDRDNWLSHVSGLFTVSIPLWLVWLLTKGRGVGGGDIKLMAAAGLFLGWRNIVLSLFLACILATVIHLMLMAAKKAGRRLAFGPYLSAAILLALLWGEGLITWYLSLL